MIKAKNVELLKNEQVQQEISRHRWFESEKAHADIGYEKAATDWLNSYSDAWLAAHKPAAQVATPKRDAKKMIKK